jgi:hypothetical protein
MPAEQRRRIATRDGHLDSSGNRRVRPEPGCGILLPRRTPVNAQEKGENRAYDRTEVDGSRAENLCATGADPAVPVL